MSSLRKSQNSDIVQVNIHKLKMLQVILDEVLISAEYFESEPTINKRKGHPFHGKSTKAKPVAMINPATGKVVNEFSSINQAAKITGVSNSSIWQSCNTGKVRRKYHWKHLNKTQEISSD